jgi:hypothetical protein
MRTYRRESIKFAPVLLACAVAVFCGAWQVVAQPAAVPDSKALEKLISEIGATLSRAEAVQHQIRQGLDGLGAGQSTVPVASEASIDFFERKVRPIFVSKCAGCHGPEKQKGGLRLDTREGLSKGGIDGAVVQPGAPDQSMLIQAVRYTGTLKMPPDGPLGPAEVQALEEWVQLGAPWPVDESAESKAGVDPESGRNFWSFQPIANVTPPELKDDTWSKTPIDKFVFAKLRENGLTPAAFADKRTLIRRATFDLTGLPPAPEAVDAFVEDDSAEAFEKVIERLLASPQYGERWGRHWLDVVRYTDSFDSRGSPATDPVEIWKYRDWVVNAFNRDMPYDKFMEYQIAGDLLPPDGAQPVEGAVFNPDGIIATGMLAIGNWPQGDADKQKMVADIVDDQVDVVTRGMLGITMGCARCHDHKFDPFTTRDYYAMAGIFFSSSILPGPGQKTEGSPILHIPLAPKSAIEAESKRQARLKELDGQITARADEVRVQWMRENLSRADAYVLGAADFRDAKRNGSSHSTVSEYAVSHDLQPDALLRWLNFLGFAEHPHMTVPARNVGGVAGLYSLRSAADTPSVVVNTTAADAKFLSIVQPPKSVSIHPSPTAPVAAVWTSPVAGAIDVKAEVTDADKTCGDGVAWKIERWSLSGNNVELMAGAIDNGGTSGPISVSAGDVLAGDRLALVVLPKNGHACDTTSIKLTLTSLRDQSQTWDLSLDSLARFEKDEVANPFQDRFGNPEVWHFLDMANPAPPIAEIAKVEPTLAVWQEVYARLREGSGDVREALAAAALAFRDALVAAAPASAALPADEKSAQGINKLLTKAGPMWLDVPPSPATAAGEELAAWRKEVEQLRASAPAPFDTAIGIQEGGVPNTEHAGVHNVRVHIRGDYNRLGDEVPRGFPVVLASNHQPAIANGSGRYELAKWVASRENPLPARVMVNRIWQHHFGNGIVRTAGNFGAKGEMPSDPALLDYLARGFIESGWSIKSMHRQIMLSAVYQQSSNPSAETLALDPDNRYFSRMSRRRLDAEEVRDAMLAVSGQLDLTMGGPATPDLLSKRRTMYYRTVRSDRTSFNMLFDAADPTALTDKRVESTVAPQALFMLNHPLVLAQAEALSARMQAVTTDTEARVRSIYRSLFTREASADELQTAKLAIDALRGGGSGDAHAWAGFAQVLLCSNEFIFVD